MKNYEKQSLKKTTKKNNPLQKLKLQPKTATQNQVLKEITLSQKQEETQNPLAKKHRATCKNKSQSPAKKNLEKHTKLLAKKKNAKKKNYCKNKQTQNTLQQKKTQQPLPKKKNWQKKTQKLLHKPSQNPLKKKTIEKM